MIEFLLNWLYGALCVGVGYWLKGYKDDQELLEKYKNEAKESK